MDGKALNERRFFRDKNGQFFSDLLRMSSVVKKISDFFLSWWEFSFCSLSLPAIQPEFVDFLQDDFGQIIIIRRAPLSANIQFLTPRHCLILSSRHPLVLSLCRLVVVLPLVAPPSCPLVLLSLCHPRVVSSCRLVAVLPLVATPSRHLVTRHSHPLVVLSLRHPLVVLVW